MFFSMKEITQHFCSTFLIFALIASMGEALNFRMQPRIRQLQLRTGGGGGSIPVWRPSAFAAEILTWNNVRGFFLN